MRWRGPVALGAMWVSAAVLATTVGLLAVHLVAGEVGEQASAPLSDDKVGEALAGVTPASTPTRPTATPTRSAVPSASADPRDVGALRTLETRGGVVSARCVEGAPDLLYASPAEGWRTDRSRDSLVRFVSSSKAVTVRLTCSGSRLLAAIRTDDLDDDGPTPTPSPHESSESPEPSESPDASQSPEPDRSDDPSDDGH